jgi:hypothetical protein
MDPRARRSGSTPSPDHQSAVRERTPSVPPEAASVPPRRASVPPEPTNVPPRRASVPPPRAPSVPPPAPSIPPRAQGTLPPVSAGAARERLEKKLRVAQALVQSLPPGHVQGRLLQVAILRRDEALLDGVLASLGAAGKSVPPGR